MTVYFAQTGHGGLIKIGCSGHPEYRIKRMQRRGGPRIELLATVAGEQTVEGSFHEMFADLRVHGEWFSPGAALIATIERIRSGTFDITSLPIVTSRFRSAAANLTWAKRRARKAA